MSIALKPLIEQVIVITGASSGIGLATARAAAARGARVVLAARYQNALAKISDELNHTGLLWEQAKARRPNSSAATTNGPAFHVSN